MAGGFAVWRARAFKAFALGFWAGAAYHAAGIFRPGWTEPVFAGRHLAFLAVNAGAALGLRRRGPVYFAAISLLTFQQLYSHILYGLEVWRSQHRVDWASVIVFAGMPLLWLLLLSELDRGNRDPAAPGA